MKIDEWFLVTQQSLADGRELAEALGLSLFARCILQTLLAGCPLTPEVESSLPEALDELTAHGLVHVWRGRRHFAPVRARHTLAAVRAVVSVAFPS